MSQFDHGKGDRILQLSVSSVQPQIPVVQSSSLGGWQVSGRGCPHSIHLRTCNCEKIISNHHSSVKKMKEYNGKSFGKQLQLTVKNVFTASGLIILSYIMFIKEEGYHSLFFPHPRKCKEKNCPLMDIVHSNKKLNNHCYQNHLNLFFILHF